MKKLREMSGIIEVEEICWNPQNLEGMAFLENWPKFDKASERLFGVNHNDTFKEDDDEIDEWEMHFDICYLPYEGETKLVWDLMGWDLTDKKGVELVCAEHFKRQIVVVEKQLMPLAKFHPLADGVRSDCLKSAVEIEIEESTLEQRLETAASEFVKQKPLER